MRLNNAVDMPADAIKMDQAEVKRRWGAEIDAVPLAPVQFNFHFVQAKDDLTPESAAMIPDVLRAIQERRSTDISLIGHTDTTGEDAANHKLGLRRAQRMAELLRSSGVDPTSLTATSHGERDLLVQTPDGVAEPRNRRVEISVR
jgi:outer membrane protein OmpA-like peptidoglycan-associated protein